MRDMAEDSDSTVVGVRVTESRRNKLEKHVEENGEYRSLPDLFRTAVAHEMSDDYGRIDVRESRGTDENVSQLAATVTKLRSDIQDLADDVASLTDEVQGSGRDRTVQRMSAVHHALPSEPANALELDAVKNQFDDADEESIWNTLMALYQDGQIRRADDGGWYAPEPDSDEL